MQAFIFPLQGPPLPLHPPRRLRSSQNTARIPPQAIRRRSLRASSPPDPPPPPKNRSDDSPAGDNSVDEEATDESVSDISDKRVAPAASENEASDLALPDLRELYAKKGRAGCEQCEGKGEIGCPVCVGKGFVSMTMMDTVSSSQCRLCRGGCSIPCPTCRAIVYRSVIWWDQIPSKDDDPRETWREGPDGEPRIPWGNNPAE